jgi:hypothetical protein
VNTGFALPNGDILCALWTDDAAVEDDLGVRATLAFPDLSAQRVIGMDVFFGFEQELNSEPENGYLVIHQLLVKDNPTILRLIDWRLHALAVCCVAGAVDAVAPVAASAIRLPRCGKSAPTTT